MLEELRIRGLGVIEDAVLPLGRSGSQRSGSQRGGLTVVTGETGAGKTMVVTGLLLLFGGRADAGRVRAGSDAASVDGRIELPDDPALRARIEDAGGQLDEDGTLLIRRVVTAAGRSRAHVGGAAVPVGVVAEIADRLIAVHGQSDQLRLARPAEQRAALDRFAGDDGPTTRYAAAYARWREAAARLQDRTERARELRREADLLRHGIAEIEAAAPQPGEDLALAREASRLAAADSLRTAARTAHDALLGDPDDPTGDAADAVTLLGAARRALQAQAGDDPDLDALTDRLTDLAALAADLGAELREYVDRLDADPHRLAEVHARRAVLTALIRKYGDAAGGAVGDATAGRADNSSAVLAWAEHARARLDDLDVSDEALAALAADRDAAEGEAAGAAAALSEQRQKAAVDLAAAVTAELAGLAMPHAQFGVSVRHRPAAAGAPSLLLDGVRVTAGPDGVDDVEFQLRAHPDAPAVPIARGASGGELSRIMLALEVCLAGTDPVPTLVFDEVDAGVGGRAAVEVGRRLSRLARDHQVLVVTHLAQVAAHADRHIVVDKLAAAGDAGGSVTVSDVRVVEDADRIAELARMLAGAATAAALQHAEELLREAQQGGVAQRGAPA